MDDPQPMAVVDSFADLLEHLHDETLVEQLVPSVPLDPLEEVTAVAVFHHDHHALGHWDRDGLIDLHHVNVVDLCLNFHLDANSENS